MKKIKYFILPFLAILGVVNVKAYDFNGINKSTRTEFGLYQDTTRLIQISCTSSNDGYCGFEDSELPNSSNTYNNVLFHTRDIMNTTFQLGNQYKFSFYFYQYTAGYFLRSGDITSVTGVSYRDFTNWTSDSMTVVSYNLSLLESENNKGLYRLDIVAIPTTTSIVGFSFRVYQDYETISNNNECYFEGTRYFSISQLTPGQIDYTQDFNQVNQNINDLGDTITDNQNQNTQDIINNQNVNTEAIIKSNMTCNSNLFNNSNWEWGSLSSSTGNNTDNNNHKYMRTKDFITVKPNITYNFSIKSGYRFHLIVYYTDGTFSSSQNVYNSFSFTTPNNISQIKFYWRTTGTATNITESVSALNIFVGSEDDCFNKIDKINDSITDSTPPDTNALSNASGWLPPGPVDSILNLPLTLLQSLNNAFSSNSCQPINVNLPYVNTPLTIPCMSTVWKGFGLLNFFTWIGRVIGGVLLYKYLIGLYKWVDDTLTMRENNNFDDGSLG